MIENKRLKILYVTKGSGNMTGAGTYAEMLIDEMGSRHEVKVYESEADLTKQWDIVHVTDIKHLSKKLFKLLPHPVVIDIHDYYWTRFYPFFSIDLPLRLIFQKCRKFNYNRLIKEADAVITHSLFVNDLIDHSAKYMIYIGIPPIDTFKTGEKAERENLILFAGRDYFRKGIFPLLNALRLVKKEVPDARLVVVGKEFLHSKLFAKLLSIGLPVEFIDGMKREELLHLYRRAKVFALPSHIEAFGIAILEAMATGTPIVAAKVGGIPEIIREGENGILVNRGDPVPLSRALIKCLTDEKTSAGLAEKGYKTFNSRFLVKNMIESLETAYMDIIKHGGNIGYGEKPSKQDR